MSKNKQPQPITLKSLSDAPLVSVLTPCYNANKYIKETIETVLEQTYQNWEMVICDDGSSDDSVDIIKSFAAKDSRIRLVQQENGGAASATNHAYTECKGEIIAFLDADDLFMPEKLTQCVDAFLNHPDSGFLTHRLRGIDQHGDDIGLVFPGVPSLVSGWFAPYIFDKQPTRGSSAPSAGNMVRREAMESLMPIPLECQRTQDSYVLITAILQTPAIGLDKILGSYRVHPEGQSRGEFYTEKYHERRLRDQHATVIAVRDFCSEQDFDDLVKYLEVDFFIENAGYLDNVVILYMLTDSLPDTVKGHDVKDLARLGTAKVSRLMPLLRLPRNMRRMTIWAYRNVLPLAKLILPKKGVGLESR